MARRAKHNKSCNICGADLICPQCGVSSKVGTPFSLWLRDTHMNVSVHDIDYVWHNYEEGWFMTLEEKSHNGTQTQSQKETQGIVFQFLRSASPRLCLTQSGWRDIEYRGHHVIVLENTTPKNGNVYLDGVLINEDALLAFLNSGRKPHDQDNEQITERESTFQAPVT